MKISIIGSGNAATVLGRLLIQNNFLIEEVVSRNPIHASNLAKELNAIAVDNIKSVSKNSDVYIIAVNDDAIEIVSSQLNVGDKTVVHTCGSVTMNILKNTSTNFGVLYPLQSLRKEIAYSPVIPFLIDGNNKTTKDLIKEIASTLSNNITEATDEQRLHYHLSAVIVSNFTNHLFSLTQEYCIVSNIQFSLLLPLIEEVVKRLHSFNPSEMQTGPAIRGDMSTIEKHLVLLENFPHLKNVYQVISESIMQGKR